MFRNGFGSIFGNAGMDEDESSSHQQSQQQNVDTTGLYELMGVPKTATTDEIKKVFRRRAVKEHPDKGGDPDKFRKLTEAYEILQNPEKRDLYDKYGMEGVKNGGGPGGDINDLLGSFFGFGGGGKRDTGPKKMKPKLRELSVTLEDVYEGKMLKIKHTRKRPCEACDGKGGANAKTCSTCKGKRIVQKMTMLGPGMYSQSQGPCTDCKGEGVQMSEKDRCKKCKGERLMDQDKLIEVPLEKGVPEEHDYVFYGESDEIPGAMAGDLYFRVKIEKHKVFERKGADLYTKKKITLVEALTGCSFTLKFLDDSTLFISTIPGEIISPMQMKTVKGKGMPYYKDAMSHGNLHVQFEIEFPKPRSLKPEQIEQLKQILPAVAANNKGKTDPRKALMLEEYDESETNPNPEGGKMRDDDDDNQRQQQGGTNVQCAQQ